MSLIGSMNAQEKSWSLDDCMHYAANNGLSVKKQMHQADSYKADAMPLSHRFSLLLTQASGLNTIMDVQLTLRQIPIMMYQHSTTTTMVLSPSLFSQADNSSING